MSPKISVIVPIYKVEAYLEDCVNSLLSQTFKDFELILINDGSPDNCDAMIHAYAKQDARIVAIHQENAGLSAARNTGIDHAKGEYLTFIDSDDWVHPTYLKTLYNLTKTHEADIVVVNHQPTHTFTTELEDVSVKPKVYDQRQAIEALYGPNDVAMSVAWGKLFHRTLFSTLRFEVGKLHEDEFFNYRIYDQATRVVFLNQTLYYYRLRDDSITGVGFNAKGTMHKIEALEGRLDYLNKNGYDALVALTYPVLFEHMVALHQHTKGTPDIAFNQRFKELKKAMRSITLPLSFKVYYELYYLWPSLALNLKKRRK